MKPDSAPIRVGVGGWTFEPWRASFYPPGLRQADELAYAAGRLGAIEINGTFYRTQTPASFRKWAAETPDNFVFALKGHRSIVNRGKLAEAGPAVTRFVESGITELGSKLGPILWQLPPTKKFDEADLGAFLEALPRDLDGVAIRHVLEVRHDSFLSPDFIALARRFHIPVVYAQAEKYPAIADITGDFIYARLQGCREDEPAGYPDAELEAWADRVRLWQAGGAPADLPLVAEPGKPAKIAASKPAARECFVFFISGAKVRAPHAAMALIRRLEAAG